MKPKADAAGLDGTELLFLQMLLEPAFPSLHTPKPLENITFTGLDVARRDLARDLALDLKNVIIYLLKIKYIKYL